MLAKRLVAYGLLLNMFGCGDDSGSAPLGASGGGVVCDNGQDSATGVCALSPEGEVCEMAPNPACAPVAFVEVTNPGADGPCMRILIDNSCDEVLYATTCIEFRRPDDDDNRWQCWTSTSLPGADIDVGQCNATGQWAHWSGHSSGELDVIDGSCDPR